MVLRESLLITFFLATFRFIPAVGRAIICQGRNLTSSSTCLRAFFTSSLRRKFPALGFPSPPPPLVPHIPKTIAPAAYADDTNDYLKISSRGEAETISSIFLDLKIATGLSINPSKTQIVTPVPEQISPEAKDALSMLGTIVNSAEHLGIIIAGDYQTSYNLSWENTISKLEKKISLIGWKINYSDMKARILLISALLQSTVNHVIRVFPPSPELIARLDKILIKTLWQNNYHGQTYGHTLVAKSRLHLPVKMGGLNWKLMISRAVTGFLSSLFHTVKYILSNPSSTLATLVPIDSNALFRQSSSSDLSHLKSTSKKIFLLPKDTFNFYFNNFALRLGQMEKHPDYFHFSALQYAPVEASGHPDIRRSLFKLTKAELELFPSHASIASVLYRPTNREDMLPLNTDPPLKLNVEKTNSLPEKTRVKLEHTISDLNIAFSNKKPTNLINKISRLNPENSHNFIYRAVHINNTFFTIPYYRMEQSFPSPNLLNSKSDAPPAYETRKRDGAVCPSKSTFNSAFLFVQKSKLPSRSKSFILSVLNRTAPSKRKLFRCKIAKNEVCDLCNVVCDNYHIAAECMFSFMLVTALRKYLEPKNIKLTENTFAFFAPIPNISNNFNSQLIHCICEVARRAYSVVEHDRLTQWTGIHFYAQIRSTLMSVINVRKHAGWACKELINFEVFFSSYIDKISELMPLNIDHFRATPTYTPSCTSFDSNQSFEEFARRNHTRPRLIVM